MARSGPPERTADRRPATADTDLVAAAQRDPAAFVALYDRYFARVHGYVRLRIRDRETCEDVTSAVFTAALAGIRAFHGTGEGGGNVGAWLFRIAHNAVYDVYRKGGEARVPPGADELFGLLPDPDPGPEDRALAGERAARLRALVGDLRPEQPHLIALRYGADLSPNEIARVVGKSGAAVRVALHRALHDLRRRYTHDE